ncbi:MAG TPA: Clp protease N-terminal domain-containing protein, partial [Jatrophihabitantaceae bacterium]|nr:Clp protease N-terminal domain-containing protein [Jatrophihabitantaceae bacterium]
MDLTTRSQQALSAAVRTAAERGNPQVLPVHLALALLDDRESLTWPVLQHLDVDPAGSSARLQGIVDGLPAATGASVGAPQSSRELLTVLSNAEREARDRGDEYVSAEHLLLAVAAQPDIAAALGV